MAALSCQLPQANPEIEILTLIRDASESTVKAQGVNTSPLKEGTAILADKRHWLADEGTSVGFCARSTLQRK